MPTTLLHTQPAPRTCKCTWVIQQIATTTNFATGCAWSGDPCNNNYSVKHEGSHMLKDLHELASAWSGDGEVKSDLGPAPLTRSVWSLGPPDPDSFIVWRIEITM
jgi:hypothetical protein